MYDKHPNIKYMEKELTYIERVMLEMDDVEFEFDERPDADVRHTRNRQALEMMLSLENKSALQNLFARLKNSRLDGFQMMCDNPYEIIQAAEKLGLTIRQTVIYCLISGLESQYSSGVGDSHIMTYTRATRRYLHANGDDISVLCQKRLIRAVEGTRPDKPLYLTVRN